MLFLNIPTFFLVPVGWGKEWVTWTPLLPFTPSTHLSSLPGCSWMNVQRLEVGPRCFHRESWTAWIIVCWTHDYVDLLGCYLLEQVVTWRKSKSKQLDAWCVGCCSPRQCTSQRWNESCYMLCRGTIFFQFLIPKCFHVACAAAGCSFFLLAGPPRIYFPCFLHSNPSPCAPLKIKSSPPFSF